MLAQNFIPLTPQVKALFSLFSVKTFEKDKQRITVTLVFALQRTLNTMTSMSPATASWSCLMGTCKHLAHHAEH